MTGENIGAVDENKDTGSKILFEGDGFRHGEFFGHLKKSDIINSVSQNSLSL